MYMEESVCPVEEVRGRYLLGTDPTIYSSLGELI